MKKKNEHLERVEKVKEKFLQKKSFKKYYPSTITMTIEKKDDEKEKKKH